MRKFEEIGKIENINDLPPEIIKELSQAEKLDKMEEKIINLITYTYDKIANIDEIIVGMYRNYGIIKTRDYYVGKLYKMVRKKVLFSMPKKKGIYAVKGYVLLTNDGEE